MSATERLAIRASIRGRVQGVNFRARTRQTALELGLSGWVRNEDDGSVTVHAEGEAPCVSRLVGFLRHGPRGAEVDDAEVREVPLEGHEQFAIRGISAGEFIVQEHSASTHHFDLRLEVDGLMRSWAVPKGPSLDPATKRLAVQVPDHELSRKPSEAASGAGGAIVWDRGSYEQGGRVPWPDALDRGHAVFVLHGRKLHGGFALQRTGTGEKAQWLLIKRRDEYARSGSDIVAEQPRSVISGRTLAQLLRGATA